MTPVQPGSGLLARAVGAFTHTEEREIVVEVPEGPMTFEFPEGFTLKVEEEELFRSGLMKYRLTPNITMLDFLFFGLHRELGIFSSLVEKSVFDSLTADLETCYAQIVELKTQDFAPLSEYLKNFRNTLIRSNLTLNRQAGSHHDKSAGDMQAIKDSFYTRVELFKKFVQRCDLLLAPVWKIVPRYFQNAKKTGYVKETFEFNAVFLARVLRALMRVKPEIQEGLYEQIITLVRNAGDVVVVGNAGVRQVLVEAMKLTNACYMDQLLVDGCPFYHEIVSYYVELNKKYSTLEADRQIQQGHVPRYGMINLVSSSDKLYEFRVAGLIENGFYLTPDEAALIGEIFKYPLDEELTLMELIGFALFERMEKLKGFSAHGPEIEFMQGVMSCCILQLWVGLHRESVEYVQLLGAKNKNSDKFCLLPEYVGKVFDMEIRTFEKRISTHKQLLDRFRRDVVPIKEWLVKILSSKGRFKLLTKAAAMYQGFESLKEEKPGGDTLCKYWHFLKSGYEHGRKTTQLSVAFNFSKILENDRFFHGERSKKEMLAFGQKITDQIYATQMQTTARTKELRAAAQGRLTHANWVQMHRLPKVYKKSHEEFKEQLFSIVYLNNLFVCQMIDFLRLVEKRLYPKGTLLTEACYWRLRFNMQVVEENAMNVIVHGGVLQAVSQEIEAALRKMESVFVFNVTNPETMQAVFNYGGWLVELKPWERLILQTFTKTLGSLALLKKEMLERYEKTWNSLSFSELEKIKPQEIKEALFNEGLVILRPLMVLSDMLRLMQHRRYSEEAAVIPHELADIMELDELDVLHARLMREKTPSPELPKPPDVVKKEPAAVKASVKKPERKPVEEEAPDDDVRELAQLTKSRHVLSRLQEMGFFEVRQTGSHRILHGPQGGQVVVPNNSELPPGTSKSIAKQAAAALPKK
jgi:predicted RNA binding protein YcfA (HicA-like mRNA interferase family)